MKRVHSFEFNDQPWLPAAVRNAMTDYLEFAERLCKLYEPVIPILAGALRETGCRRVVDLCSGAGGPWLEVLPRLRALGLDIDVTLTDKFPNPALLDRLPDPLREHIAYHAESVDARDVPESLDGLRTVWTALHHFEPDDVRAILQNAVDRNAPFAAFEFTRPDWRYFLTMILAPLVVLLTTPFIRPFRWSRVHVTYTVPVLPFIVLWDGMVSCLRTYTPGELEAMTASLHGEGYAWRSGEALAKGIPSPVLYLIGIPRQEPDPKGTS